MAGRAASRATLAARPAQAVAPSPSTPSSFPQRQCAQCERRALLDLGHSQTLCSVRVLIFTGFAIRRRCKVALGRGADSMMIALEARAPALNRLRSWPLVVDQDLFGRWQFVMTFGRIGRLGQATYTHSRMRRVSPTSCCAPR
jgi:hypothetical protein